MFGAVHYARILGAILWVRDCTRRGQDPVHGDLTPALLADYVEQGQFDRLEDDVEVPDPPKLSESNFLEWEEAMLAKLGTKIGVRGVPLSYVVRRGLPPGRTIDDIQDSAERLIHETTHEGAQYRRDNIAVGQYIKGVLSGQDATAWVENFIDSNDGSEMINSLRTHFLGASQVEKIIEQARKRRDSAHYVRKAPTPSRSFPLTSSEHLQHSCVMVTKCQQANKYVYYERKSRQTIRRSMRL